MNKKGVFMLYMQEKSGVVSVIKYRLLTWWHNATKVPQVQTVYTFHWDPMKDVRMGVIQKVMEHRYSDDENDRWMKGSPCPVPVFRNKADAQYASRVLSVPFVRKWYPVYHD